MVIIVMDMLHNSQATCFVVEDRSGIVVEKASVFLFKGSN